MINHVRLSGTLAEKKVMRYTPGGVQVLDVTLVHTGQAVEGSLQRALHVEIRAKALGEMAGQAERIPLGSQIEVTGFLAPSRQHSKLLVLHITNIETEH